MYMNNSYLQSGPNQGSTNMQSMLTTPQPQDFIRSHSDNPMQMAHAAPYNNNQYGFMNFQPRLDMLQQPSHEAEFMLNDQSMNGIRMKRYNSLPDVSDYLDSVPTTMDQHQHQQQQQQQPMSMNPLIDVFNNRNKLMEKQTNYYDSLHTNLDLLHSQPQNQQLNHLSVPLSVSISNNSVTSIPYENMYIKTSHEPSPVNRSPMFVSNGELNLNTSQPYESNKELTRKRLLEDNNYMDLMTTGTESMAMNIANMQPTSNYTNNDLSPITPHVPQQHNFYTPTMLDQMNQFKRSRNEMELFQAQQYLDDPYTMSNQLGLATTIQMQPQQIQVQSNHGHGIVQPAPSPDETTAQAARDAIVLASQHEPPSDPNDPESRPRKQHLRFPGDLYTPQWVRYSGHKKEGYCDLCGAPGKWLQLKNSAYWYHKQFYHGISSVSGKFFAGPLQSRRKIDASDSLSESIEGLCHQCHMWVPMASAKRRNSVLWFRHAHKCHIYHKPKNVYGAKK